MTLFQLYCFSRTVSIRCLYFTVSLCVARQPTARNAQLRSCHCIGAICFGVSCRFCCFVLASNVQSLYSYLLDDLGSINGWFFRKNTQVSLIAFTCNDNFVTSKSCQIDSGVAATAAAAAAIHRC